MKKLAVCLVLIFTLTGCNSVAKNFGGTVTVNLDEGRKLEEVTWKNVLL